MKGPWPDPAQPGVPLSPTQSGWHWLRYKNGDDLIPLRWSDYDGGPGCFGWETDGDSSPEDAARWWVYVGPCAMPDEVTELRRNIVAFCTPWAVEYARERGLPKGHLYPAHYDILQRAGARMDDFTRAEAQP